MIKLKEIYDKIIEEIEPQEYEIYSDMDGVLVDFNARYKDLTGKDPNLHRYISFKRAQKNPELSKDEIQFQVNTEFWKPITDEGIGYWEGMDWMPDGKKYWNYIKKYNPKLLSAPGKISGSTKEDPNSREGKRKWAEKNLPGTELVLASAKTKSNYAKENAILIDDFASNIKRWEAAGGIGILHKNANDTIQQLKKLGL